MREKLTLIYLWITVIIGLALGRNNYYGTFYKKSGTSTVQSSTYTPTPFAVGDLSSSAGTNQSDPPGFIFVAGSQYDTQSLWTGRYVEKSCTLTFDVFVPSDIAVTSVSYLNVTLETSENNETDTCVMDTGLGIATSFNISNNGTNIVTLGAPPGIVSPFTFCVNNPDCTTTMVVGSCPDLSSALDPSYTDPNWPMVILATERNEIKADMPASTSCGEITWNWYIMRVSDDETTFSVETSYVVADNVLLIYENRLSEGRYIVFLEARTSYPISTYTSNHIFLKVELPGLKPIITGTSFLSVHSNSITNIYANSASDPAIGVPDVVNYPLDAEWHVLTSDAINRTAALECVAKFPACDLLTSDDMNATFVAHQVPYRGRRLQVDTSIISAEWVFVIYRMVHRSRRSSALVVLQIQHDVYTNYQYSCVYGCVSGVVNKSPVGIAGFEVFISYNGNYYDLQYTRNILEWDDLSSAFVPSSIQLKQGHVSTDLSLTDAPLVAGGLYLLSLDVLLISLINPTSRPNKTISLVVMKRINFPPYNGACSLDKTTGTATSDMFMASCMFWMDEDERLERDPLLDGNPRLSYMVVQRNYSSGLSEPVDDILVVSDQATMNFTVLEGDPYTGYSATIVVMVLDMFNEAAEVPFTITANPIFDVSSITSDHSGAATIQNFTTTINASFYEHEDIDMSIPIGTGAGKTLNTISVPPPEMRLPVTIDSEPGVLMDLNINVGSRKDNFTFDNYLTALYNTTLDPATVAIRESIELITRRINTVMVERVNSGQKYRDQNYLDQLTQCFTMLISVQTYVTDSTKTMAESALATLAAASGNIWVSTPQSEDQQIESKSQLTDMTGNIVNVVVPDNLNQARAVYDMDSALDQIDNMVLLAGPNMTQAQRDSNISPSERAYLYQQSQRTLQTELYKSKKLARDTAQSMNGMAHDVLQTTDLCTGCSLLLGSGSMIQNVSIMPRDQLNNVTLTARSGSLNVQLDVDNTSSSASTVAMSMMHLDKNIFMYDNDLTSSSVSYGVLHATLHTPDPVAMETVTYEQAVDHVDRELVYPYLHADDVSQFALHKFIYRSPSDEVCLNLEPIDDNTLSYDVYLRFDEAPTIRDFDTKFAVTGDNNWVSCLGASNMKGHTGIVYVGVKRIEGSSPSRKKRDTVVASSFEPAETELHKHLYATSATSAAYRRYVSGRRKRATTTHTVATTSVLANSTNGTTSQNPPYYFAVVTASCLNWDETTTSWNSNRCKLTWDYMSSKVSCVCHNVPQMTFGTSFFVAPNSIDFSSAFLKFSPKSQAAIIGTIAVVFIAYAILLVWARREDHRDMLKWGILPLSDNYPEDDHCYLVSVHTGLRLGAGTQSRVGFVLSGHRTDTGVREMYDGYRKQFAAGSVQQFLMTTQYHLGQLMHLRVWHDNSGPGSMASWYLSRVTVYDMRKKEMYNFLCESWLSVETCSGSALECTLPATNPENEAFDYTFMSHAKRTLSDDHTWVSFLYRPSFSNFTRTQRVTCAILFIMVNMVVNAMYYNPAEEYETDTLLEIGPCRLSLNQLSVSIITALITTPSTFLVVLIFKMSRRSSMRLTETNTPEKRYKTESQTDSRPESHIESRSESQTESRSKSQNDSRPESQTDSRFESQTDSRPESRNDSLSNDKSASQQDVKVSCCTRICSGPRTEEAPVMYIEEENRTCLLPSQFAYVGWFLALGGIVTSSFFVLVYSMQWGEQKSGEWLATFLMSLLQSILFVDPIKVAALAICLAFVKKTLETSDFKNVDNNTVETLAKSADMSDELPRQPLSETEVKVAREKSKVATRWNRIVLDLVYNVLFLWLLLSISYSNTNTHSYNVNRAIVNAMTLNDTGHDEFGQISTAAGFYKWLQQTAVPRLFPAAYSNGQGLNWITRGYIQGMELYRVGPPRLRQFRVEKENCHLPYVETKDCYGGYSLSREESRDFCVGWQNTPCSIASANYTDASWLYTDLDTTDSLPLLGDISAYSGDGYFMTMDINRNLSIEFIEELYDNVWIDRHTRAVALEFTVFCGNINMFAYSFFLVEFPASGGAFSSYSVFPARIYQHEGTMGRYIFACEILGLLFLVLLLVQLIYGFFSYKCAAFKKFWFLLDFLRFCVLIATVALYIIRHRVLAAAIDKFHENRRAFVEFYHVTGWNQLVIYMLGVCVFMSTIRFLKILEGNKNIYIISSVFSKLSSDLFWFGVLFFYFFFTFATLGYMLFGAHLRSYQNLYKSIVTLIGSLLGKNRFAEMDETAPILAKIYFFFFVCIISMMLFSIVLSSLTQCIMRVTAEYDRRGHKQDAFHYGFSKMVAAIGGRKDQTSQQDRVYAFRDVNRVYAFRDVNSRQRTIETPSDLQSCA